MAEGLQRLLALGFWQENGWAIFFWGWTLAVTLWLAGIPASQPDQNPAGQSAMAIDFAGVFFEQLDEQNARLTLRSPQASFDPESNRFLIQEPVITWQREGEEAIFSATSEFGSFEAATIESNLPSDFSQLELSGGARARSGDTSVDAPTLIFNNASKLFYIPPGPYEMRRGAMRVASPESEGLYYDPILNKMNSSRDELLEQRPSTESANP